MDSRTERLFAQYQQAFKAGDVVSWSTNWSGARYGEFLSFEVTSETVNKGPDDRVGNPPSLTKQVSTINAIVKSEAGVEQKVAANKLSRVFRQQR